MAVGLGKNPTDKHQDPHITLTSTAATGSLAAWIVQKTNGELGIAAIVPGPEFHGMTSDDRNFLILAQVASGQPLRYLAGAAWSRAGEITTRTAWDEYVAAWSARARAPVKIALAATP